MRISRKGTGISPASAGLAGIPADARGADETGIPEARGSLKKLSRRGRWQSRSFRTVNAYFMYGAAASSEIRCVHDLRLVDSIDVLDRWGRFQLRFRSPTDPPMKLKAKNLAEAERWVENLTLRRQYFEEKDKGSSGCGNKRNGRSSRMEPNETPLVIQRFESTPHAEARADEYRKRFESAFTEPTAMSIEDEITALNLFMEELTDTVEICRHRPEIVLDQISSAHPLFSRKLHACTWGDCPGSSRAAEAHEALKLIDFISSYATLLADVDASPQVESYLADHSDELQEYQKSTAFLEKDQGPRMLEHLTKIYVASSGRDLLNMARDIARYVLENPNKAIQTDRDTGIVSSSGSVDVMRMASRYLEHAQRVSDYEILRARVLMMICEPVCAFAHALALRTAQVRHLLLNDHPGEQLLFLCVVVNDCEFLVEKFAEVTEEHLEDLENAVKMESLSGPGLFDKIQEAVDSTESSCEETRELAMLQVERVIFDDMDALSRNLFSSDIMPLQNGATVNVEPELVTMLVTLDDYFLDLISRIRPQSFVRLLGYCANRLLSVYVRRWIDAHTEQSLKGYRIALTGKKALTSALRETACARLRVGIEEILQSFQRFGETLCPSAFFGLERTLRTQVRMAQMVLDVAYRSPLSSLVSDVFDPISRVYTSQPVALGHIFALFSTASLVRDFHGEAKRWQAAFPDAKDAMGSPAVFPFSRRRILDSCFKALQYQKHTVKSLTGALAVEIDASTSRMRRLPSKSEMKLRNKGKKRQEVLVGDQADAALEIVRADSTRNAFMRVFDSNAKVNSQIQHDAKVASGEILGMKISRFKSAGRLAGILSRSRRAASVGSISSGISTAPEAQASPAPRSRTKSWWAKKKNKSAAPAGSPRNSLSAVVDQDRYEAVVGQAQELLATKAITRMEYTELVKTFDRHLSTGSPAFSPNSPSSGAESTLAEYKKQMLQKAAASRQSAPALMIDPEAKAKAQKEWLAHALGSHFSAFDKLPKDTQEALVGAMEMSMHRAEDGRALMTQGEEGDKMFVIGTGNFNVLVSGSTNSFDKPDEFGEISGEISGELSVTVATLGPGSVCGEIGLLFSAPRNATVMLREGEAAATLWSISRDAFNAAVDQSDDAAGLALLKKQFASDPRSRRHGGGGQQVVLSENKSRTVQEMQRRLTKRSRRKTRIATPGDLAVSDNSVAAPNFEIVRSLQESDAALVALHNMAMSRELHRRGSFLNTSTGKRVLDPAVLWRWAIKKVIFQAAVEKTAAFLEERQGASTVPIPTCPVSTVGRDWNDWLDKEIEVLTGKLDDGKIDQAIYDRRVALLEARWARHI